MKKILFILISMLSVMGACKHKDSGLRELLDDGWTIRGNGKSYPATVPSTIIGAGVPDTSDFDAVWTYTRNFCADIASDQHLTLEFDGIGYYGRIIFNGQVLDKTEGVFLSHKYDVTPILRRNNKLSVQLRKAGPGDLNIGFVDWNPVPEDASMGIVRPVYTHITGAVRIDNIFVKPVLTDNYTKADLELRFTLSNLSEKAVDAVSEFELEGRSFKVSTPLEAGETKEVKVAPGQFEALHLDNPRLWWCRGLGSPELYCIKAQTSVKGELSDKSEAVFGVREITSRLNARNHRIFTLNGRDVLIKGAGWTDDRYLRDTHESIETQVQYVADMNLNCIRFENIWGKDDYVYDLCDRYGLLAMVGWSCQWEWESYMGSEEGKYGCIISEHQIDLAEAYFKDQVVRLRNHPSVFAWLTGSDKIPTPELEKRYLKAYEELDYRPYVNSAAAKTSKLSGPSGMKMAGPYDYEGPDYWFVDSKYGGAYGFNTETGMGVQIPEVESLSKFIGKLWPLGREWDAHCTSSGSHANSMALFTEAVNGTFGPAADLKDYLRKGNALSYDSTRSMFEAFRCNVPEATGIVQWMLNSAWPSVYWQLYDWYLVPTASYYAVKKACEPVQIIYNYKDGGAYVVNGTPGTAKGVARISVFDAQSHLIYSEEKAFEAESRGSRKLFIDPAAGTGHFVIIGIDGQGSNAYAVPASGNVYNWEDTDWCYTPIERYCNLSFVSALPAAEVQAKVEKADDGKWTVRLSNKASVLAYRVVLKFKDDEGEILTPVFMEDNHLTLMPGEERALTICSKHNLGKARLEVSGWNVKEL